MTPEFAPLFSDAWNARLKDSTTIVLIITHSFHYLHTLLISAAQLPSPTSPKAMGILALPDELLDMIVTASTQWPMRKQESVALLKALRQVCKRFSFLHSVAGTLFRGIRFIADCDYLAEFTEANLLRSEISSYVKRITFISPLRAPMSLQELKGVFRSQKEDEYGAYWRDKWHDVRSPAEIQQLRDLAPPFPDRLEMFRGYQKYNEQASRSLRLVSSVDGLNSWSSLLRHFPHCTSFQFAAVDYNVISLEFNPLMPYCFLLASERRVWDRMHCSVQSAAEISDFFHSRVAACLTEAQIRIEELYLGQAKTADANLLWSKNSTFMSMDLNRLRVLHIEPCFESPTGYGRGTGDNRILSQDIDSLLVRCANSLQTLKSGHPYVGSRHSKPVPPPCLQSLDISSCVMSSRFFQDWLRDMPKLEHIEVIGVSLEYGEELDDYEPVENWKLFFDAVRDHLGIRQGCLEVCIDGERSSLCVVFNKDDIWDEWVWERKPSKARSKVLRFLERHYPDEPDLWCKYYLRGDIEWFGLDKFGWSNA